MADISDVEQAMVETITNILYPEGLTQSSIVGALCRIYRGWPNSGTLGNDLNAGTVNVTINAGNDSGRTTTRYIPRWGVTPAEPGVVATVVGTFLTISGQPLVGDVVGAMIDGKVYAYRVKSGDTVDLVAASLGQLIGVDRMVNMRGTTVTVPGAGTMAARTVCDKTASFESRRQEKDLQVACWCPSPSVRDSVVAAIDAALVQVNFLILPDETASRITYRNTVSFDQSQNALLYRRDLIYMVEYATVSAVKQPSMLFGASDLNTNITYG